MCGSGKRQGHRADFPPVSLAEANRESVKVCPQAQITYVLIYFFSLESRDGVGAVSSSQGTERECFLMENCRDKLGRVINELPSGCCLLFLTVAGHLIALPWDLSTVRWLPGECLIRLQRNLGQLGTATEHTKAVV